MCCYLANISQSEHANAKSSCIETVQSSILKMVIVKEEPTWRVSSAQVECVRQVDYRYSLVYHTIADMLT